MGNDIKFLLTWRGAGWRGLCVTGLLTALEVVWGEWCAPRCSMGHQLCALGAVLDPQHPQHWRAKQSAAALVFRLFLFWAPDVENHLLFFCFDNQGKWTLHLIAFLLAMVGSRDFISGPAALFAYQPLAFLRVLSLFPLRLWSWLNCLLTAYFFHRNLLHFLLSWNQCCRWCASLPAQHTSALLGQLSWRCIVLLLCISHPCTKGCIHLPWSGHLKVKSTLRQCKPNPILPGLIGRNAIYSRFTKFFQEKRRKTRGLISVIKRLQVSVEQSDWRRGCASVSSSLYFAENYFVRCDLLS